MKSLIEGKHGLKILYMQDKSVEGVAVILRFNAGSLNESAGKQGLAHLVEHCLTTFSNEVYTKKELNDSLSYFPYKNAFTGLREMDFVGLCNKNDFELLINQFTSGFTEFANLNEELLEEKKVVLQEIVTRVKKNSRLAPRIFVRKMRKEKNFRRLKEEVVLGSEDSIKKLRAKDIIDYKNKFFGLNNAILCVAGNVSLKKVKKVCEKYIYARLKSEGEKGFSYEESLPIRENMLIKEESLEEQKSLLQVDWRYDDAPKFITRKEGCENAILSNIFSSMAFDKFRTKNSACYSVSLKTYAEFKDRMVSFQVECSHDKVQKNYQLLLELIEEIKTKGLSQKLFEFERKSYLDGYGLDATPLVRRAQNAVDRYSLYGVPITAKTLRRERLQFEKFSFEEANKEAQRRFKGKPNIILLTKNEIKIDESKVKVLLSK